jgi:tol-pal system protein YbgF
VRYWTMLKNFYCLIFGCFLGCVPLCLHAEVPVMEMDQGSGPMIEDTASSNNNSAQNTSTASLNPEERLTRVESQLRFLDQYNLTEKINRLEQSIADLRGLVEMQGHEIQTLKDRQLVRGFMPSLASNMNHSTVVESTPSSAAGDTVNSSTQEARGKVVSAEETKAYSTAFNLIKDKKYSEAIVGLEDYLREFPQGHYLSNAHYWLGELFILSGNHVRAQEEFNILIDKYSFSDKVPDALFKLGILAYDESKFEEASQHWQRVKNQYPDSAAARLAITRLEQLKIQQGT